MTAVADPPTDTLVSQPRREVMYAARRDQLVLVHTPEYAILGPQGQKTGQMTNGVRIEFRDGQLRVPLEGEVVTAQGRQFPAPDLIAWLESHRLNGDQHEGFFRVDQAAPPVSEDEQERITEAATLHDVETLTAILEAERAGWGRSQIVRVVERRLEQIAQMRAEMEAQMRAEAEESAKPAAKKAAR